jgi:antitoxin (DNA-binding transcriptional repressor) of toxin-antitoxin stability system
MNVGATRQMNRTLGIVVRRSTAKANNLSELIDRTLRGEGVLITRHGKPVIEFKPVPAQIGPVSDAELNWLASNPLGLRAPDAVNIAIAQRCAATLLTFDEKMARSARSLGMTVIN